MSEWCENKKDQDLLDFWQAMKPPARPSEDMLRIYETSIREQGLDKRGNWALLGCTPELRTLARNCERPLTCIDHDERPYTALIPMCHPPENERFVQSDWVGVDLPHQFDLVLAEGSINMLDKERHQAFMDNIYCMLRPGGCLIQRMLVSDGSGFDSAEEVIRWYRDSYQGSQPITTLRALIFIHALDHDSMTITPSAYARLLEGLYQQNILTETDYAELSSFPMNVIMNAVSMQTFETQIGNNYEILSVERPQDLPCGRVLPIYTLQRK